MSSYYTTHNESGDAIFSKALLTDRHTINHGELGLEIIYTTPELRPNLSTEADLQSYSHHRTNGFEPGRICPANGSCANIATFAPGMTFTFHRTMTVDTIIVIEGQMELLLDSGESRVLKPGDSVVQRGTMHKWRNVTPNGGVVKMATFVQPIQEPIEVGGKKLETEWTSH